MTSKLAHKKCAPCEQKTPKLTRESIADLRKQLDQGWKVVNEHHLEKEYAFDDFKQALEFTVRVGDVAEEEGHHPDIHLSWGKVRLEIWTHSIDGLSENDFIVAAKADGVRKG